MIISKKKSEEEISQRNERKSTKNINCKDYSDGKKVRIPLEEKNLGKCMHKVV